jgi:hypothetical protein
MAGKAGTRGPVPKRSSERRRRNKDSQVETAKPMSDRVEQPLVDDRWHPIARDWYESLAESGQAQFFEPSDWQYARVVADILSRLLKQRGRVSAQLFAAVTSSMNDLLTTEASRRRVRLEIERGKGGEQPASVIAIADYQKTLGV